MDVIETIKKRRSIRRFKDQAVPEDVLKGDSGLCQAGSKRGQQATLGVLCSKGS